MANIFNSGSFNATWISNPGLAGQGNGGIVTFSNADGTAGDPRTTNAALLMDSCTIDFTRSIQRRYFLNQENTGAYIIGIGDGTLQIQGLLGSAKDFASLFGEQTNLCDIKRTVTLDFSGMQRCDGADTTSGIIQLSSVVPASVRITAQIQANDGALYYSAVAAFKFTGMSIDEKKGKPAQGNAAGGTPAAGPVVDANDIDLDTIPNY